MYDLTLGLDDARERDHLTTATTTWSLDGNFHQPTQTTKTRHPRRRRIINHSVTAAMTTVSSPMPIPTPSAILSLVGESFGSLFPPVEAAVGEVAGPPSVPAFDDAIAEDVPPPFTASSPQLDWPPSPAPIISSVLRTEGVAADSHPFHTQFAELVRSLQPQLLYIADAMSFRNSTSEQRQSYVLAVS